jgi:hypothetical protein
MERAARKARGAFILLLKFSVEKYVNK